MTKPVVFKLFGKKLSYDEAVKFLDKKGYRLLTLNEWFTVRYSFPAQWCWLKKVGAEWPVARGSIYDDYGNWSLYAVDYDDDDGSRWVVGIKKKGTVREE